MSETNILETVAQLMSEFRPVCGGTYKLYAANRQLSLISNRDPPRLGCLIDTFISTDINDGLTSERWNNLQAKLLTLIQKGLL